MPDMKHVARQASNQRKCFVAYRVIPNDPQNCLVVFSDSLESPDHDTLVSLVESNAGQTAYELAEAMTRTQLPDGRNMLKHFHATGKLTKMPTDAIEMIPNFTSSVVLSELNALIAQQKGVTVEDLALQGSEAPKAAAPKTNPVEAYVEEAAPASDGVLSDEDLAAQYRSQADALFKEAKALREQAEELVPTKKRTSKTKESA